ncbi:unnamed protein product, partial [Symbiodinium necroappetens]
AMNGMAMPMSFAILSKVRNYITALMKAMTDYGLGTVPLELLECSEAFRQPMYPGASERPKFISKTVDEVMRAYASGIAIVGKPDQLANLATAKILSEDEE